MYDNDFDPKRDTDVQDEPGEFFEAPPRRKKSRAAAAVGKSLLALALVVVVAAGSITGYLWVTGDGSDVPAITAGDTLTLPSGTAEGPQTTKTNYVLGTTAEALTTPEIFVKASPWVVSITSESEVKNPFGGFYGQGGSSTQTSTGTGIIMNSDGYIITNHHVVEDATRVRVTTSGGQDYEATIVGSDEKTDIAVLKIDASGLPAAEFGNSSDLVVGEPAIVIGNPLGTDLADTLTQGVISSTERQVPFQSNTDGSTYYMSLIQTDAAVNPGNSGGPLLNSRGQVVGVVNSKISQEGVEGIGFAIPSSVALSIANDLVENGEVTIRPMLGISVNSFTEAYAQQYNAAYKEEIALGQRQAIEAGIFVNSVTAGSPAATGTNGGIKEGDKIIAFNGISVSDSAELNYQKEKCQIGDTAVITVVRDGETLDVEVTFVGGVAA